VAAVHKQNSRPCACGARRKNSCRVVNRWVRHCCLSACFAACPLRGFYGCHIRLDVVLVIRHPMCCKTGTHSVRFLPGFGAYGGVEKESLDDRHSWQPAPIRTTDDRGRECGRERASNGEGHRQRKREPARERESQREASLCLGVERVEQGVDI
jgi:hypothetical protein